MEGQENNLWFLFCKACSQAWDSIAILENAGNSVKKIPYKILYERANELKNWYFYQKIKNQKIVFLGEISFEWLTAYFGTVGSGNIVVPIDKDLPECEIMEMIRKIDGKIVLFEKKIIKKVRALKEMGGDLEYKCFAECKDFGMLSECIEERDNKNLLVNEQDMAMVVFTSGTAGYNKAVILTHDNLCSNIYYSAHLIGEKTFNKDTRYLHLLPMHHIFGLTTGILTGMLYYHWVVCLGGGIKYFTNNLKLFKPELLIGVPMIIDGMCKKIYSSIEKKVGKKFWIAYWISNVLRVLHIDVRRKMFHSILDELGNISMIICGGANPNQESIDFMDGIGVTVLNGYGITECSPVVACNKLDKRRKKSVGVMGLDPYCKVRIIDDEIQVSGKIVAKGYYDQEEFKDEWFKTGDIGYIDKDGFLFISGRKKDIIVLKDGNNIFPAEIEDKILKSDWVEMVLVYVKQTAKSEVLSCIIVPNKDKYAEYEMEKVKMEIEKVIEELNKRSPMFKQIHNIEYSEEEFERTSLGKIKRYKYNLGRE